MFDLMRVLQFSKRKKTSKPDSSQPPAAVPDPVRMLGIIHKADDQARLRQISAECAWTVLITDSFDNAMALLEDQPVPIVIYDRDFPGANWKDRLAKIASLSPNPCILLASSVMDPYLWDEVIRHHGYDIVHKPFDGDELRRVVRFAATWRQWMSEYQGRASGNSSS